MSSRLLYLLFKTQNKHHLILIDFKGFTAMHLTGHGTGVTGSLLCFNLLGTELQDLSQHQLNNAKSGDE